MSHFGEILARLLLAGLLSVVTVACSGVNLGDIDEQADAREEMPGPGILADDSGESALTWSNDNPEPAAVADAPQMTVSQEQAEFEQFKTWNELRSNSDESLEYQEFQQWQEYQKFKAGQ